VQQISSQICNEIKYRLVKDRATNIYWSSKVGVPLD